MFNTSHLEEVLVNYKQDFTTWWKDEKYKWEAIKVFQDNWDIGAKDFSTMLDTSLSGTKNLLAFNNNFPRGMIVELAKIVPDEVREMYKALFDESLDVVERIMKFKEKVSTLHKEHLADTHHNHYQTENAISVYLWLRYPDKYYIYKISVIKKVAKTLESNYAFHNGAYVNNLRNFYKLYDEISVYVNANTELKKLLEDNLTDSCYRDPKYKTLTTDICYYLKQKANKKEKPSTVPEEDTDILDDEVITKEEKTDHGYWWLVANPSYWNFSQIAIGEQQFYTLRNEKGNRRHIYQNFLDAKPGDLVIGYEATPVKKVVALCKIVASQDGEKISFEKTENLVSPIDYTTLKQQPELENMEFFNSFTGSLFRLTKEEYDFIVDLASPDSLKQDAFESYSKEDFLSEVFMTEEQYDKLTSVLEIKKNVILQGAPGVGKTFAAKRLAYSIMGEKNSSRIEFIQFHQNYSYEDFMMGYRPTESGFELRTGVFYNFCMKAANQPDSKFFFIIDEINRGNMSKIFGELLMMIENDYRGTNTTLAYDGSSFSVPKNLYIIGMMNTADRSLAMIDYALRRRFSFIEIQSGFDSEGFKKYQEKLSNETFDRLIAKVKELNEAITLDNSLGKGFCIGHSYFSNWKECTKEKMLAVVEYDIIPMLEEYWFDDTSKVQHWKDELLGVLK